MLKNNWDSDNFINLVSKTGFSLPIIFWHYTNVYPLAVLYSTVHTHRNCIMWAIHRMSMGQKQVKNSRVNQNCLSFLLIWWNLQCNLGLYPFHYHTHIPYTRPFSGLVRYRDILQSLIGISTSCFSKAIAALAALSVPSFPLISIWAEIQHTVFLHLYHHAICEVKVWSVAQKVYFGL